MFGLAEASHGEPVDEVGGAPKINRAVTFFGLFALVANPAFDIDFHQFQRRGRSFLNEWGIRSLFEESFSFL